MGTSSTELLCFNRGCGKKFREQDNDDDSCEHHPGAPFFHDAYKGWSCCKKKCTDFTEFLNIKGCTQSKHSNVKAPEPEKSEVVKDNTENIKNEKFLQPLKPSLLERPPFDSPMIKLKSTISSSLAVELAKIECDGNVPNQVLKNYTSANTMEVGTTCKNGGCKETYVNESSNDGVCQFHPGVPIFHEGLKYWTCCTKRTTDFQAFLNQEGCSNGTHNWKTKDDSLKASSTKCRHDWMQTGTHVIVNIYCKKYDPRDENVTFVEVNPVRLKIQIYFPGIGSYTNDFELRGIIDTVNSQVNFTPSKVEISLKKAEPMSWNKLDIPRPVCIKEQEKTISSAEDSLPKVDVLDLSDL